MARIARLTPMFSPAADDCRSARQGARSLVKTTVTNHQMLQLNLAISRQRASVGTLASVGSAVTVMGVSPLVLVGPRGRYRAGEAPHKDQSNEFCCSAMNYVCQCIALHVLRSELHSFWLTVTWSIGVPVLTAM